MKKKRIIGVITIKDNIAVQSFNYKNYLPLGNPEKIAKNLNDWGVDEILINVIDSTKNLSKPNYKILEKIASSKISTPIIFGGGIQKLDHAIRIINSGADRILCDSLFVKNIDEIKNISHTLGSQAVILSLPIILKKEILRYDYLSKKINKLNSNFFELFDRNYISELLITDVENEGTLDGFNLNILKKIKFKDINTILFGGLYSIKKLKKIFKKKNVNAIAIGNALNYKENSIHLLKSSSLSKYFREDY